ncbi:hypothetical protein AB0L75_12255 [Streptomyces sp. NPDC052101]|uniref:hypothetical protein n=1 Tax=Streptomyces sp. NPDC052101 TaxID=3155763 RepID=UPI00342AA8F1
MAVAVAVVDENQAPVRHRTRVPVFNFRRGKESDRREIDRRKNGMQEEDMREGKSE